MRRLKELKLRLKKLKLRKLMKLRRGKLKDFVIRRRLEVVRE